ncbi:MAG TPA: 2-C-methyl-D-erythritol 4-phosphate cytidylyltransferase [Solirubrobacteraceae bacterium]|jgi:2-C-methyl-D-erythritol 4-phosphate cytidylyltransferase|nr:2-C-methyl-D-erythritol 4-phosphate cytidylyltransferase [Solirubrobacteraceae bacterium]
MTVALIVAAGSGERLGAGRPKALVELAGAPLLQWSIDALRALHGLSEIVVALPAGTPAPPGVSTVEGGPVRSDSVRRALAAAGEGELVLVHDAARPLLTPELAGAVIAALEHDQQADAAIAAAPVTDTVKRVDGDRAVTETLDRSQLWAVQTPQVFRRVALERALAVGEDELARATDDAWLVERSGGRVIVVPSIHPNLKVTTPLDLRVAELLLQERLDPQS